MFIKEGLYVLSVYRSPVCSLSTVVIYNFVSKSSPDNGSGREEGYRVAVEGHVQEDGSRTIPEGRIQNQSKRTGPEPIQEIQKIQKEKNRNQREKQLFVSNAFHERNTFATSISRAYHHRGSKLNREESFIEQPPHFHCDYIFFTFSSAWRTFSSPSWALPLRMAGSAIGPMFRPLRTHPPPLCWSRSPIESFLRRPWLGTKSHHHSRAWKTRAMSFNFPESAKNNNKSRSLPIIMVLNPYPS